MSKVKNSFQNYLKSALSASELIHQLRDYYHSVNTSERHDAVDALGNLPTEEAARELLTLFQECNWLTTKCRILNVLGNHPSIRGLEFLIQILKENLNEPLTKAALEGLIRSQHPFAYQTLKNHLKEKFLAKKFSSLSELKATFGLKSVPKVVIHKIISTLNQNGMVQEDLNTLGNQDHPDFMAILAENSTPKAFSREQTFHFLKILQWREGSCALDLTRECEAKATREPGGILHEQWLQTIAMITATPSHTFDPILEQALAQPANIKIKIINALGCAVLKLKQSDPERLECEALFQRFVTSETNEQVIGRWIRFAAQCFYKDQKTLQIVESLFSNPNLCSSCLHFAEKVKHPELVNIILKHLKTLESLSDNWPQALKALAQQEPIPTTLDTRHVELFLKRMTGKNASAEIHLAALAFMGQNPRFHILENKDHFLQINERYRLAFIVSLRNIPNLPIPTLELLSQALQNKNESIVGRALDILTSQKVPQAIETVIDFLESRLDNPDLVDKICRCLQTADDRQGVFIQRLKNLVSKASERPCHANLLTLLERFEGGGPALSQPPQNAAN